MTRLVDLNRRFWPVPTAVILVAITVLSLAPLPELPLPEAASSDKLHHFAAYAGLAFPVALAAPRGWPWVLVLFAGWGGVIEIVQPYVNRHGEWADLAANIAGVLLGALTGSALRRALPAARAR